jgi:hypothetical protein
MNELTQIYQAEDGKFFSNLLARDQYNEIVVRPIQIVLKKIPKQNLENEEGWEYFMDLNPQPILNVMDARAIVYHRAHLLKIVLGQPRQDMPLGFGDKAICKEEDFKVIAKESPILAQAWKRLQCFDIRNDFMTETTSPEIACNADRLFFLKIKNKALDVLTTGDVTTSRSIPPVPSNGTIPQLSSSSRALTQS